MAQLTSEQRAELSAELQREWSRNRNKILVSKPELAAAISVFDAGMEAAESSILASVSAKARTWLLAHQTMARRLLEEVAKKRREVL